MSQNALIRNNTTTKLGLGIKGAGSLLGTQFKCNTSNGSYNGFYFDAAYGASQTALSYQGTTVLPNDNKWYNVPLNYFGIDAATGFLSPIITWYYRNVGGQYNPTLSTTAAARIWKTSAGNPAQFACTTCGGSLMAGLESPSIGSLSALNEMEIGNIVEETNNYGELDASFKYFEKQYAYDVLSSEINIYNSSIENFFETLENGNIGKFSKIYQMIGHNQFDSALIANNSIVPTNQIEVNRKWVNGIYIDYIATQLRIPQMTIDELVGLANSSPFVEGDAVYTARAIVDYQEPELMDNKSMETNPINSDTANIDTQINVYPNPASDFIIVEVIGEISESVLFTIYNVLGYKKKEVFISTGNMKIDISDFNQGVYWYDARISLISINKGKFIISR